MSGSRQFVVRAVIAPLVLVAVLAGLWYRQGRTVHAAAASEARPKPALPVRTATVSVRDMPNWLEGLGTVSAYQQVLVRSRVDGELARVFFREGQYVHRGDVLAQIDPRRFEATLGQAEGALARDRASLRLAQLTLDRSRTLRQNDLVAQSDVDTQTASVGQLEAALQIDQAAIANARLDVDFARIKSPIDGVVGVRLVDQGNLIHASDTTGLVIVTQIDPVAVYFTMPQDNLGIVASALARSAPVVEVYARDGTTRLGAGSLTVIDNQIVASTGTIRLKAIVPNPDHVLWPNQFVKARLLVDVRRRAVVVPTTSVLRGPDGPFVYVVNGESVRVQRITVAATDGADSIVTSGLTGGERIVVEGQSQLRPNSRVHVEGDARGPS